LIFGQNRVIIHSLDETHNQKGNCMSDIAVQREALKKEIKKVEAQLKLLQQQLSEVEKVYQEQVGNVHNGVVIKTRKSSYILTAPNGKSVVTTIAVNAHNERNIYWYDGRKGDLALANVRGSIYAIANWLKEQ
jgi:hypothetical protein